MEYDAQDALDVLTNGRLTDDGRVLYYDHATGRDWQGPAADLERLAELMNEHPIGYAYSLWCAEAFDHCEAGTTLSDIDD